MHYEIRPMSLGEILDMGFRILRNHFAVLVGLAAMIYVPLLLMGSVAQLILPQGAETSPDDIRAALPLLLGVLGAAAVWALVAWPVASAAITHAVGELYLGRSATFAESLRTGWSLVWPLSGTSLLVVLFVIGGLFLLIIPGIYLGLSYALVWPIMVLERRFGMAALRRSRHLMRGNLLRIAGLATVAGILTAVLSSAAQFGLGYVPVVGSLVSMLVRAAGTAFGTTFSVLLYFDVRCRKEAFDVEHLAQLVEQQAQSPSPAPAPIG